MSVFIGYPSFMAYQMMKGKKDNNDGFPSIPGTIARYSALGLTNEQMAANPVWVDKTGNGHDLQLKNLAWKGMSGVGGYVGDFSKWVNNRDTTEIGITKSNSKVIIDVKVSRGSGKNIVFISKSNLGISNNVTIKITSTYPEGVMKFANSASNKYLKLPSNGIITLQDNPEYTSNEMYLHLASADLGQITIEQLPLYPGALVFDGVDDWAGCDNLPLLPKEKGYSIIALRNWITRYDATQYKRPLISNLDTNDEGAFLIEYRKDENVNDVTGSYNSFTDVYIDDNNPITWQTSSSYNGQIIKKGTSKSTNKLSICKTYFGQLSNYANAAIWEIVILDHDATEEELTKIKDYFIKTYPWLFPDQAWTVVGKTNEDEDRATIANITGNGNNLVLSNFGFAEGSGYGLYGFKFFSKAGIEYYSGSKISFSKHQLDQITLIPYILVYPGTSYPREKDITAKIKVAGLKEGVSLTWGWAGNTELTITEDGTYSISAGSGKLRQMDVVYAEGFDPDHVVTIEQIPEYEGYLVTDGVDDKIVSAKSIAFTDTWTIITDAIFLGEKVVSAGILVKDIFGVSNLMEYGRVEVSVKGGVLLKVPTPSIKAICSDGRIYDADWNEYQAEPGTIKVSEGKLYIGMWYNGMQFCSIAFKNIATYNGYALSKDDCIKAYNYLQTLKAK